VGERYQLERFGEAATRDAIRKRAEVGHRRLPRLAERRDHRHGDGRREDDRVRDERHPTYDVLRTGDGRRPDTGP
jgi:hypothetical protein